MMLPLLPLNSSNLTFKTWWKALTNAQRFSISSQRNSRTAMPTWMMSKEWQHGPTHTGMTHRFWSQPLPAILWWTTCKLWVMAWRLLEISQMETTKMLVRHTVKFWSSLLANSQLKSQKIWLSSEHITHENLTFKTKIYLK